MHIIHYKLNSTPKNVRRNNKMILSTISDDKGNLRSSTQREQFCYSDKTFIVLNRKHHTLVNFTILIIFTEKILSGLL